jgi:hypothetical protein
LSEGGEPPVYRPFAALAYAATVVGGTPLGIWLLAGLHLGAPAVPPSWMLLHASLQVFGFFGTLIVGVAPHLLARFTGRPVAHPPSIRVSTLAVKRPVNWSSTRRAAKPWTAHRGAVEGRSLAGAGDVADSGASCWPAPASFLERASRPW